MTEGEGAVAQVRVCNLCKNVACPRAHQGEGTSFLRHVGQLGHAAAGQVVADPGEVVGTEAGAGDDVEVLVRQPGDRQVAFNAAAAGQHLGVGDPSRRAHHVVAADPV